MISCSPSALYAELSSLFFAICTHDRILTNKSATVLNCMTTTPHYFRNQSSPSSSIKFNYIRSVLYAYHVQKIIRISTYCKIQSGSAKPGRHCMHKWCRIFSNSLWDASHTHFPFVHYACGRALTKWIFMNCVFPLISRSYLNISPEILRFAQICSGNIVREQHSSRMHLANLKSFRWKSQGLDQSCLVQLDFIQSVTNTIWFVLDLVSCLYFQSWPIFMDDLEPISILFTAILLISIRLKATINLLCTLYFDITKYRCCPHSLSNLLEKEHNQKYSKYWCIKKVNWTVWYISLYKTVSNLHVKNYTSN